MSRIRFYKVDYQKRVLKLKKGGNIKTQENKWFSVTNKENNCFRKVDIQTKSSSREWAEATNFACGIVESL